MQNRQVRRRRICVHEAGHCFARWFFGFDTSVAIVISRGDIENPLIGEINEPRAICEGQVVGDHILPWEVGPDTHISGIDGIDEAATLQFQAELSRRAAIAVIEAVSGFVAEAKYRKRAWYACMLETGYGDMLLVEAIQKRWPTPDTSSFKLAIARSKACVLKSRLDCYLRDGRSSSSTRDDDRRHD